MADNLITINAPKQGIASSPHVGFGDVRNIDIHSVIGAARLNKNMGKRSGTTVTGAPLWLAPDQKNSGNSYALDINGVPYWGTTNSTSWSVINGYSSSNTSGNGLAIWKDYLFLAKDAEVDTFGPLSGMTFTATEANPMVLTTSVAHGLNVNDRVILYSTGNLTSSGAVEFANQGVAYYVSAKTDTTLTLSSTSGGIDLNLSGGSQSGTHRLKAWRRNSLAYWQQIDSDVDWHPMYTSVNDSKLYGGAGKYVFAVEENSGQTFNPGISASYTFTSQALDLPTDYRIKAISELGSYLMLGTWQGTLINDFPVADIFPWDRSSTSFAQPIKVREFGCHALFNDNGHLIMLAGLKGTVFECDGVNYREIAKLPIDQNPSNGAYPVYYPGGISKFKDKIYFTVSGSNTLGNMGIYALKQTGQGTILTMEHTVSTLTDGSSTQLIIPCVAALAQDTLGVGWLESTSYGIDTTATSSYAYSTSYSGYFDTPLYRLGNPKSKPPITSIEIEFAKKLITGQGVRVQYRTNLTDSFTTLGTYTSDVAGTTKIGLNDSYFGQVSIKASKVQFRIALLGTASGTPELLSITLS